MNLLKYLLRSFFRFFSLQNKKYMAKLNDMALAILTKFDEATTEVAKDLKRLRDEARESGDLEATLQKMDRIADRLVVMGKDPEDVDPGGEGDGGDTGDKDAKDDVTGGEGEDEEDAA